MLSKVDTKKNTTYVIRFNSMAALALRGIEWVEISKTKDNAHIILTPCFEPDNVRTRGVAHINRCHWAEADYPRICADYMVKHEGFLKSEWFNGKRYKVKKGKDRKIIICIKEVVEEGA